MLLYSIHGILLPAKTGCSEWRWRETIQGSCSKITRISHSIPTMMSMLCTVLPYELISASPPATPAQLSPARGRLRTCTEPEMALRQAQGEHLTMRLNPPSETANIVFHTADADREKRSEELWEPPPGPLSPGVLTLHKHHLHNHTTLRQQGNSIGDLF